MCKRARTHARACYEGLKWRAGKALKDTGPQSLVLAIRRERNAGMYLCLSVAHYTTHSSRVFRQTACQRGFIEPTYRIVYAVNNCILSAQLNIVMAFLSLNVYFNLEAF